MYTPNLADQTVRSLYRLARIRGIPMTRLIDEIACKYIARHQHELAGYDPAIHDRHPAQKRLRAA